MATRPRRVLGTVCAALAIACCDLRTSLGQSAGNSSPPSAEPGAPPADSYAFLKQVLNTNVTPIDIASALRLAGVQNSQILLARQRVIEALAERQLAAAQFLPTLNAGTNIDSHRGVLQRSTNGTILRVNRDALYLGAGAYAVGSGTVNVPGVLLTGIVSETIYNCLVSRQEVRRREFATQVVEQDTLLSVALAYIELVRGEEQAQVARQTRDDAREVHRLTVAYLSVGEGRKPDADRAATELARREALLVHAEGQIGTASARLCELLHLDPSLRLHPTDEHVIPSSLVPEPIPLPELLTIALLNRPELRERRTAIVQALLRLDAARMLPFSPTIYIGYSAGTFGGGSSLVAAPAGSGPDALGDPRFGLFSPRQDLDAMAYWTLLNLGVGNRAMIDAVRSRLRSANLKEVVMFDLIRSQVASAYAKTHARFAQIRTGELAIKSGTEAYQEDTNRIRAHIPHEGLPLELLNSMRLLARSRDEYVNAILDYNAAQFELYVALGRPPADVLIRPANAAPDEQGVPPAPR